jgi:4a-hydroxytetrahydrobiopterin dehydratase
VPELRRRIRWTGFGEGRPAVVDDHEFDIARHVTAVDLGGVDEPAFWSWSANQTLQPLDREHPLWRVTFATGLAGGQVGVLVVLHHALADGMAGAALAGRLLDPAPDTVAAPRPWRPAPAPGPLALAAPATSLDHAVGPGRRLIVIRRPLEQVKQAGRAHGATVNDVLLAAVAGGLRQLLAGRGEPVEGLELRVSVPVGAPGRARNAGGSTPMVLPLPVGPLDPADRLARIVAVTRTAKAARDRRYRGLLASPLLPTSLLRLGVRWLRRHGGGKVNLYVTNVPGPYGWPGLACGPRPRSRPWSPASRWPWRRCRMPASWSSPCRPTTPWRTWTRWQVAWGLTTSTGSAPSGRLSLAWPSLRAMDTKPITPRRFHEAAGVEDWRVLGEGACAYFRTGSFAAGARLAQAIGELDGLDAHHPDIDVRQKGVTVRLITITDDDYGLSERDLDLARQISAVARQLGFAADPTMLQTVQVSIDALVSAEVMPFWRAVLGYEYRADSPDEDLVDPRDRGPSIWFQRMDAPRPQRNRMHIDVWVPHDQAEARVAAAIAAGGRLVTDEHAPMWWVLADPEGNEVDVATWMSRD